MLKAYIGNIPLQGERNWSTVYTLLDRLRTSVIVGDVFPNCLFFFFPSDSKLYTSMLALCCDGLYSSH